MRKRSVGEEGIHPKRSLLDTDPPIGVSSGNMLCGASQVNRWPSSQRPPCGSLASALARERKIGLKRCLGPPFEREGPVSDLDVCLREYAGRPALDRPACVRGQSPAC